MQREQGISNARALLAQIKGLSSSGPKSSWAEETTTPLHDLFPELNAAPWAPRCLEIRSLGRDFSSVSESHTRKRRIQRETIETRTARPGLWRWLHQSFVVPSPLFSSAAGAGFHRQTTSVMLDGRLLLVRILVDGPAGSGRTSR